VTRTVYINLTDINPLQQEIMLFIQGWVREEKTPVPQKEIVLGMGRAGKKSFTVINSIKGLLTKGYIRRAYMISNKTYYVQLRSVNS